MAHIHSVYDTDKHFTIDLATRALVNQTPEKVCVMQYDHDSERITFDLPAKVEEHNILDCNRVEVHYLNIDAQTKEQRQGLYEVDDLQLSPADEAVAICSWLISMNATQLVGPLYFRVTFKCVTDGNIDYSWSTAIYKALTVSDGINCTEYVAEQYADVLAAFDERLCAVEAGGGGSVDLDTTLTQSGKAADAKAVGDALANVSSAAVAYVQADAPTDVPVGTLWYDTDEPEGGASVDIPAALPNPHKLTFSGAVSAEYDGSAAVEVMIPQGGGSGSSGGDTWKLLHTLTLAEDTKYITQELGGSYDAVCIAFTNLWCVEGTTCGVAAAVNSGSVDTAAKSASMGGFINNSNYPAKGCVEIEKFGDVCRMIFAGANSAGNYSQSGVGAVATDVSGGIARIQFSLAAYGTHTMNAGAVIRIYGR